MSRFSIVIPVYKTEAYLDHCVESVVAQTFTDFEIILVDDGSPDRCGAMCDIWADRDSRIRVLHQENGGLSAARNAGIRCASGDYVMFLDSDDWWAEDTVLASVAQNLQRTDADVLSFNYQKAYNGVPEPPYFSQSLPSSDAAETLEQIMRHGRWINGACNKAVRRRMILQENLFFRTGITSEDIDWTIRLAICADKFAFENVSVFIYRQIASSISHSMSTQKVECLHDNVWECVRLIQGADSSKVRWLREYTAYQYGTLLHNVALLPEEQRSERLISGARDLRWLLDCSDNQKVRLLRICVSAMGLQGTLWMLRMRQRILDRTGKGV